MTPVWLLPPFSAISVAVPAVAVVEIDTGDPTRPVTVATVCGEPLTGPSVRMTDEIPAPSVVSTP